MKEFSFDAENGPTLFLMIWMAFGYIGQNGQARPIEILRLEASISKKLRDISEPVEDIRTLTGQSLKLTDSEIALIQSRIETFPMWNPLAEISPVDLYDWLNN